MKIGSIPNKAHYNTYGLIRVTVGVVPSRLVSVRTRNVIGTGYAFHPHVIKCRILLDLQSFKHTLYSP